ncbi:MAG: hypothetical protein AAF915_26135 [Cyanobacteria bacterium P01_D01_bin.50]
MTYCTGKDLATIKYKFGEGEDKVLVVEKENLPVQVAKEQIKKSSGIRTNFFERFEGREPGSYSFTVNAPSGVPEGVEVEIYLTSGTWDDYGRIGDYSTGYGIVKKYEGEPLLVGKGRTIQGSVTNVEPVSCYVRVSLDWRFENTCKLVVFHKNKVIYEETGDCPLNFQTTCDQDCPPRTLKCASSKYPGYCCLPCKSTANKIRNLGNKL